MLLNVLVDDDIAVPVKRNEAFVGDDLESGIVGCKVQSSDLGEFGKDRQLFSHFIQGADLPVKPADDDIVRA